MEQKGYVCPMYKKYEVVLLWIVSIKYTVAAMMKIYARVNKCY